MPYFGRRTIYLWGMLGMCLSLLVIGVLNVWTERKSVAYAQAILTLVWTFVFQLSVGQLGWALPAEMGSTRLRQKTICLAKNINGVAGITVGILQQYFMNPQAWNVKGYVGYVLIPLSLANYSLIIRFLDSSGGAHVLVHLSGRISDFPRRGTDPMRSWMFFSAIMFPRGNSQALK